MLALCMTFTARLQVLVVSGVAVSDRIPSKGLRLPSSGGSGTGSGGTPLLVHNGVHMPVKARLNTAMGTSASAPLRV